MDSTSIYKEGILMHVINDYISVKEALLIARQEGILGRVEINYKRKLNSDRFILSLYFINEQDQIVGEVYPCLSYFI